MTVIPDGITGYLIIGAIALLAHEPWRWAGAFAGRTVKETDDVFVWINYVSAALVAGLAMRLMFFPAGVLAGIDLPYRLIALAVAAISFMVSKRNLGAGMLAGCITLLALGYFAPRL